MQFTGGSPLAGPEDQILDFLAAHRVAVIATAAGSAPWASTVYYVAQGGNLLINTPITTRMLRNLKENERVAYAVDDRVPDLFLQGEGRAEELLPGSAWEEAAALLRDRVPEAHVGQEGFTIVKITSERVVLSDFRSGFKPPAVVVLKEEDGRV